jgi:SPP1 gp7 family putative phage head morphogenesis protein
LPELRDLRKLEHANWVALDKVERSFREEVRRNYRQALESIREEMSSIYEKYAVDGELTKAQMTKYNRLAKLEKRINEILGKAHSKNTGTFLRLKESQYSGSFFRHQWALEQNVGASLNWGALSEDMIERAIDNDMLKIANDRLKTLGRQRVRRAVTQGLIRGDSYDKMARSIKSAINGTFADAERIVRTEGQKAAVKGQQDSYNKARENTGVEVVQVWDATLDGRTRPEHGRLDGRERNEEEGGWYVPGIGYVSGPLQSGVASFDINCRCRVRGEVKDYPPKVRRIRDEGVQPYQTFEQWAKSRGITKNKYGQKLFG